MSYFPRLREPHILSIGVGLTALILSAAAVSAQTPECPGYDPDLGIIWGVVRSLERGVPVPGADIAAHWNGGDTEAQSLQDGLYIVCGVRTGVPVIIRAGVDPFTGAGVAAALDPGEILEVPLTVVFGMTPAAAITGRVVGTIVDRRSLQPVSSAMIGAGGQGYTGITDGAGRFVLDGLPPGEHTIRVRHIAYGETETRFLMPSDETLEIQVQLDPAVLPIEPIEVKIVGVRSHRLEMAGFYERRAWNKRLGLGHFMTRADIEARAAARISHVLLEIPRLEMLRGNCRSSRCDVVVFASSPPRCKQLRVEGGEAFIGASLYIDGRRMRVATGGAATGVDDFLMPGDVSGIEVYSGPSSLPAEFADPNSQRCGAIVIWTGR